MNMSNHFNKNSKIFLVLCKVNDKILKLVFLTFWVGKGQQRLKITVFSTLLLQELYKNKYLNFNVDQLLFYPETL